jgi:GH35 family endo-1,4-beta-xylanase
MASDRYAHRKGLVKLGLAFPNGKRPSRQPVQIVQRSHEFLFGCGGFDAVEYAGGNPDGSALGENYREFLRNRLDTIFKLCNYATLPFYWGRYEKEEGKPDQSRLKAGAQWFEDRKIAVKGHPLCWHTVCADWLMKYSSKEILAKQCARIEREASGFKGLIDRWDVINEAVIMPVFDKYDNGITRICKDLGRVRLIREVFNAAKKANPKAILLINDFSTAIDYEILIDGCLQAGIPIDAIGIQSHQHQGYWGVEKLRQVLDRFSTFGLPLHWTENTIISGDLMPSHIVDLNDWQVPEWPTTPEGEERQAREMLEFYEELFAHPLVEAVTHWDPSDGKWLGAPSGLLRADNTPKPVYHELMKKIHGEWRTEETVTSDENGEIVFRGFKGDYRLVMQDVQADFTLDGKNTELNITFKE